MEDAILKTFVRSAMLVVLVRLIFRSNWFVSMVYARQERLDESNCLRRTVRLGGLCLIGRANEPGKRATWRPLGLLKIPSVATEVAFLPISCTSTVIGGHIRRKFLYTCSNSKPV